MAVPVYAARRGAPPSRRHAGQGFRLAAPIDRAQSRPAGGEAVSLELLALNPFFYAARLAAGALLAHGGHGDTAHFPGARGKLAIVRALAAGDFAALRLIPRMLRKRAQIRSIRCLTPGEVRRLLLAHRLSLAEAV